MTARDRLVLSVLGAAALMAAAWFLAVAPKRKDANTAGTALNAAHATLTSAQQQVAQARVAATTYAQNLHAVKSDYRAVPATDGVANLLPTLQRTSTQHKVDFRVITVAAVAATPGTPSAPSPAAPPTSGTPVATPAGATAAAPGTAAAANASAAGAFSQTSFTFTFNGGYRLFQSFLHNLDRFVVVLPDGKVLAHNRLLVINSVALKPQAPAHGVTQAAITASAYSQPPATASPSGAGATPVLALPTSPGVSR